MYDLKLGLLPVPQWSILSYIWFKAQGSRIYSQHPKGPSLAEVVVNIPFLEIEVLKLHAAGRKVGKMFLCVVREVYSCLEQKSGKGENGESEGENFPSGFFIAKKGVSK